ncbi:PucR family transcriptional regulator [Rathayibacter rathayi]|uniref:PucR family transcriptional regulator n=1 Tax=Rathayibacter rathayi TaxID=33887 RepID=A0ABX5ACR4_RATRA|nr:PucR family transcriptional regulator [Rathayibacter rathayi]AZZ47951.1 PucR family transcriptional regulator [Rathayibacter rathayi]MWV74787.1 PucR family transcriptional regulator [Rathayibacter rathayi NCPPB 2980 = VKM Ac-1601]PPF51259.1 PucR family transcriptional regulator [Rathayibacter rathayi]PPF80341.1 PucR family transcriptional regulator [Rathayibacter rathayi]PPG12472.1 PucR family transcriptional regulator [Rathayibacter rathayi]
MPATVRDLLAEPAFRLRILAGVHDEAVLDAPLSWAHSSDLVDPTPWLESGQLLLTDGVHFTGHDGVEFSEEYVARLRGRGIRALGFATRIVHDEVPAALIAACERQGLPLLEVAELTPFMGIIRFVADVISREQRERLEWSLEAQRRVAHAALRPDGLGAILTELERQLGCWVALYDAAGHRVHLPTRLAVPAEESIAAAARHALSRGSRAGLRLDDGGGVTLQTIGRRDHLRGVLAVGTGTPLDPAGNDLVASVIALASIALEQRRALDSSRRQLQSGLLELLAAGAFDVAESTARRLGRALPAEPVRVVVLSAPVQGDSLLDELEVVAEEEDATLFFAERDGSLVAMTAADKLDPLTAVLQRHGATGGASAPLGWADLDRGIAEARRAAERTGGPLTRFEDVAAEGMLGLLAASGAEPLARRMLAPLLSPDGAVLLESARAWLRRNGAWEPAARDLGVHRHTLRNRITAVERALGLDLDDVSARTELWTALRLIH